MITRGTDANTRSYSGNYVHQSSNMIASCGHVPEHAGTTSSLPEECRSRDRLARSRSLSESWPQTVLSLESVVPFSNLGGTTSMMCFPDVSRRVLSPRRWFPRSPLFLGLICLSVGVDHLGSHARCNKMHRESPCYAKVLHSDIVCPLVRNFELNPIG